MLRQGTLRTVSFTSACGDARSGIASSPRIVVDAVVMPSGAKMRSRTKSSHDLPDTLATTCPAATYMMFW